MGDWILLAAAGILSGGLVLWSIRQIRTGMRQWFDRAVVRAVFRFRARLDRYKLVAKRTIRTALLDDLVVREAIRSHARVQGVTETEARIRVEQYVDEIVPHFNVLSYYKVGYNLARVLVGLLYRVDAGQVEPDAIRGIPRNDIIVYLMNHRSNADYVVVAYVLARAVSISYAVGEWARVWPLEYVFKTFGAYFVRRGFRDPLYHTVLRRYVQLITRNGVTQGIFLEGGLSRDGRLRPAKIGLLDHIVSTLPELGGSRDIWLIPVALNYDRVLEDRSLILELVDDVHRPSRLRQFGGVVSYVASNLLRLITGNLRRYGRAHVVLGAPISVREWAERETGLFALPKEDRLSRVQQLADRVLERLAEIIPITPVPLTAAALLSFGETAIRREALLERIDRYRDGMLQRGARLVQPERDAQAILDRAWRMLRMRRLVVRHGETYVVLPSQRPLLEYYANSIQHLLPAADTAAPMHPAQEPDTSLPKLRPWQSSQRPRP